MTLIYCSMLLSLLNYYGIIAIGYGIALIPVYIEIALDIYLLREWWVNLWHI